MMTTEDVIKELLQESGSGKDAIIVSVNSDLLRRAARDLESLTAENERLRSLPEQLRERHFMTAHTDMVGDEERREGYLKALSDIVKLINQQRTDNGRS